MMIMTETKVSSAAVIVDLIPKDDNRGVSKDTRH